MVLLAPASTKEDATVDLTLYIFWISKHAILKAVISKGILGLSGQWYTNFGQTWELFFFVKVTNLHISCNYFPFLVCQRGVHLLYKTLDTLIENSAVLQSDSFGFADRHTYKSNDQALKQHRCLRRKNNFSGYRHPNNFLLPQFAVKELHLEIFFPKDFPKFSKPISRNVFRCLVS